MGGDGRAWGCRAWRTVLVAAGAWALAMELGWGEGVYNPLAWHYFTDISNMAGVLYFACALAWRGGACGAPAPRVKHAVTMALAVTFLVAHGMLTAVLWAQGWPPDVAALGVGPVEAARLLVLHYVVPLMALGDWALFEQKGRMGAFEPLGWVVAPLLFLAYVFFCTEVLGVPMGGGLITSGRFPYPFLDVDALGIGPVALICLALLVAFVALGHAWRLLDGRLARRTAGKAPL